MRTITLSQLRNTRLWLPWLKAGEKIELRYRKRLIAWIVPDESSIRKSGRNSSGTAKKT
jgi:hypothetical protein